MKIKVIEVKKIKTNDGKQFDAFKTIGKGGRKMDLRFVQGCNNIPTEPCFIEVNDEDANVDTTRQYPILWVKNVQSIIPFERKNNLKDYFDDAE